MSRDAATPEKKTLIRGVLVLVPAALFAKIVGMFYKIPLLFIVGVEGMAYFLAAYHVYSFLFVLCATGLPTALSLLISGLVAKGQGKSVGRLFGLALAAFLTLGALGTVLLFFAAPLLAERLAMGEAASAIAAIAPALFLAAFSGAVKGFFQGYNRMAPTAVCEALEAAGKLGFGLLFAFLAKARGLPVPQIAAYAVLGITTGMLLSALVSGVWWLVFWLRSAPREGTSVPCRALFSRLLRVAVPITLGAAMMSAVSLLDTVLISARLQDAGFSAPIAHAMYSSYGNLAIPLYNLVPSLLSPVTLALIPLLGAAVAKGARGDGTLESALRVTALIAIPAALGLSVFARPLLCLVFRGQDAAITMAAPLLCVLALAVLPASLLTLTGGALQATGHTALPVVATAIGAAVKLLVEYVLLTDPHFFLMGAPVSTLCCTLTVLVIEWAALSHAMPHALPLGCLWRPFLASAVSVSLGIALYALLYLRAGEAIWLMPSVLALVGGAQIFFAFFFHALEKTDLQCLPFGDKLCECLKRCKLMK